jgi:type I restriction enzyme S subunit
MEVFRAIARDKATTMGHIQRRHLAEARLPLPTAEAMREGDAVLEPLDGHRAALVSESRTLTLVRDALLPKLISGQMHVPDTADSAEVIEPAAERLATAS